MVSPLEKYIKFFTLELDRGCDNRAVLGGLEKILPSWEIESRQANVSDEIILLITSHLQDYSSHDIPDRRESMNTIISALTAIPDHQVPFPVGVQFSPEKTDRQEYLANQYQISGVPPGLQRVKQPPTPAGASPSTGLNAPLTVLPGIGPGYAQTLQTLGLNSMGDLLYYFPRRYDDFSQLKPINRLKYGEELTVAGTVSSISTRPIRSGSHQLIEVVITDGTGFLRINWFNQPWLSTKLIPGTQIILSGKIDMYLGRLVMNSPEWETVEQEHLHTNRIVPIYPLTARVTQRWLRRLMHKTVTFWAPRIPDYLPESIRQAAGLINLSTAIQHCHFPDSNDLLRAARSRLAFDEIFLLQLGVLRQKQNWLSIPARPYTISDEALQQAISCLPYELTGAQQRVFADIRTDLASGKPMNRLLQGDVGSGKTVIAALAASIVCLNGSQAAFMAPTSILAEQHYRSLQKFLANHPDNPNAPFEPHQIRLLVGDTPESERNEIRSGLEDNTIKILIGTHALIEDPVKFNQLQLAVIDEQHRFGVAQRAALRSKGDNPHLLVMTATPIPRSLALTIYGDLDLSVLDEMPPGRQPVETHVLSPLERERAYHLIKTQIQQGHQAFIIYPLINQGDDDEARAAVEEHQRLQKEVFPKMEIGLLHGRLRPDEKENAMKRFRGGDYQILVSTSVIEVGVDIPNATVMLIEGADNFGLSQLHQFRGRVGRGLDHSYCLLIPENQDALENERLTVMSETNDGFILAERDLQQRGPGDFLGTRQSGFAELKMASLTDIHMIEKARHYAQILFNQDPDLKKPENEILEHAVRRFWGIGKGDLS